MLYCRPLKKLFTASWHDLYAKNIICLFMQRYMQRARSSWNVSLSFIPNTPLILHPFLSIPSALAQVVIPCFRDSCFDLIPSLTPLQAIFNLAARMRTPLPPYHLKDTSCSSVAHMKPSIISPAHILPKFPLLLAILLQLPQSNATLPRILTYLRVLEHPMFLHLF